MPADIGVEDESSLASGFSDSQTTGNNGNYEAAVPDDDTAKLRKDIKSRKQDKAIVRLKVAMVVALISTALAVALTLYFIMDKQENDAFREAYTLEQQKVIQSVASSLYFSLGAIDSFMVDTVSSAVESNQTWPLVTNRFFAARAQKLLGLSHSIVLSQYHVVQKDERETWENYSVVSDEWLLDTVETMQADPFFKGQIVDSWSTEKSIHFSNGLVPLDDPGPMIPKWQSYPVVTRWPPYNWDARDLEQLDAALPSLLNSIAVIGATDNVPEDPNNAEDVREAEANSVFMSQFLGQEETGQVEPISNIFYPIVEAVQGNSTDERVVGILAATFFWKNLFSEALATNVVIVLHNGCGQKTFTYEIKEGRSQYVGPGDLHDRKYTKLGRSIALDNLEELSKNGGLAYSGFPLASNVCPHLVSVYPSARLEQTFITNNPILFAVCAVAIVLTTVLVFVAYDWSVQQRQKQIQASEARSNAIVSSLFPANVHDRLYTTVDTKQAGQAKSKENYDQSDPNVPIADWFPACTVIFCDISGFTSWSSERQPEQVFILLEAIYGKFDWIAKKRGVYKVETIGDSYVAVTGLPVQRKDHAVIMAKFARDCRDQMHTVTSALEISLGPGTGDLSMRFGLHSGPVTAGVLRGERSRFQLFGDTVNTAARMESTGKRGCIQASRATYQELCKLGKEHWCTEREGEVEAKGKGIMCTYWIDPCSSDTNIVSTEESSAHVQDPPAIASSYDFNARVGRLVDWNVELLGQSIQSLGPPLERALEKDDCTADPDTIAEVVDEIPFIPFSAATRSEESQNFSLNELGPQVEAELRDYVSQIAVAYNHRANAFHNFEHACHATLSMHKLLSVIKKNASDERKSLESSEADSSYGIASDPLARFACIFSALIHDVGHPGIPNNELVNEDQALARKYNGESVAENEALHFAWWLFMKDSFVNLRGAICSTEAELLRFRQLVTNGVLATDIADTKLASKRNGRFANVFSESAVDSPGSAIINRKATLVVELLLQASDIAHTMQHWNIYRKWNQHLYEERAQAFLDGRSEVEPSESWYQGVLQFFDDFVIPLARKLTACGVFGVGYEECLSYAEKNREEWEMRGPEIVRELMKKHSKPESSKARVSM